jgi:hypothetical protein
VAAFGECVAQLGVAAVGVVEVVGVELGAAVGEVVDSVFELGDGLGEAAVDLGCPF